MGRPDSDPGIGGAIAELRKRGVRVVFLTNDPRSSGHDEFNYDELRIATSALRRNARLYAAGRDATFPMPDGTWPGTGSVVAAVEAAGGKRATTVGKPESYMFEFARSLLNGCGAVAFRSMSTRCGG